MDNQKLTTRINKQLRAAGMTNYGFTKLETSYLPEIIHEDENVMAVVYGLLSESADSVMLVATDKRVLFLDCKPIYKNYDELSYEVVSGVNTGIVGPFASLILQTRVRNFSLRYVNITCAKNFATYIETHIEVHSSAHETPPNAQAYDQLPSMHEAASKTDAPQMPDNTAVLSTIDKNNQPYASVVHFVYGKDESYYFLTKTGTKKAKNISSNNHVAFTVHPPGSLRVLYVLGTVSLVTDKTVRDTVYGIVSTPQNYAEGTKFAPILKIDAGEYIVFKINAEDTKLLDYSTSTW